MNFNNIIKNVVIGAKELFNPKTLVDGEKMIGDGDLNESVMCRFYLNVAPSYLIGEGRNRYRINSCMVDSHTDYFHGKDDLELGNNLLYKTTICGKEHIKMVKNYSISYVLASKREAKRKGWEALDMKDPYNKRLKDAMLKW